MTQLCAIPTCRIRHRHLPTCPDPEHCAGCQPRTTDEGLTCDPCLASISTRLAAIIRLAPDARAVAAGLVRRGTGGSSGKPASRPPLNDGATDALDEITNTLTTIARDIADTRGLQIASDGPTPTHPLIRACSWLTGQLGWLRHALDDQGQAYAVTVFAEIRDCASRIRTLVEGPADRRYLGPCGAELATIAAYGPHPEQFVMCDGDIYARDGAATGRCSTCGAQVGTAERQAWLDTEVRTHAFTAKDIADAYGINVKTIRSWGTERQARHDHSGTLVQAARPAKLREHGRDRDGRSLFLVGDVLDLAADDAARRETARNDRERRKTVRETAEMGA